MSKDREPLRRFLILGGLIGGILSVAIALLMDVLFSDALQGTWTTSISHDLNRCFHLNTTPKSFIVYIVFILILGILFIIGALLGALFSVILYRFFQMLSPSEK